MPRGRRKGEGGSKSCIEGCLCKKHMYIGRVWTEEQKRKASLSHLGKPHNNGRLGKHHSDETKEKIRNTHLSKPVPSHMRRGASNMNYRGKSIISPTILKEWRLLVFDRDDYTCQICYIRGVALNADHIVPKYLDLRLTYAVANGRTLCIPCHKETDTYGKRYSRPKEYQLPLPMVI